MDARCKPVLTIESYNRAIDSVISITPNVAMQPILEMFWNYAMQGGLTR